MSLRFSALEGINEGKEVEVSGSAKITAIFGENVFTIQKARAFLSDEGYKSLLASIRGGKKIDRNVANQVAAGIRPNGLALAQHRPPQIARYTFGLPAADLHGCLSPCFVEKPMHRSGCL